MFSSCPGIARPVIRHPTCGLWLVRANGWLDAANSWLVSVTPLETVSSQYQNIYSVAVNVLPTLPESNTLCLYLCCDSINLKRIFRFSPSLDLSFLLSLYTALLHATSNHKDTDSHKRYYSLFYIQNGFIIPSKRPNNTTGWSLTNQNFCITVLVVLLSIVFLFLRTVSLFSLVK